MRTFNKLIASIAGSFAFVLFAGVEVAAQGQAPAATVETLHFNGGRAMADTTEALQSKYALAITYEDPLFVAPSDMRDITAQVSRHPGDGHRTFVPVGPPFQFQFLVKDGKAEEGPLDLLRRMVTEYAAQGGPVFDVQERTGRFGKQWNVKPVRFRNAAGQLADQPALLDTVITIPMEKRSILYFMAEICQQLSQSSGHTVVLGNVPFHLDSGSIEFSATNRVARDILADLLDRRGLFTWRFLDDPGLHWDALNVHPVRSLTALLTRPVKTGTPENSNAPSTTGSRPAKTRDQVRLPPIALLHRLETPEGISAIQSALARNGYYQGDPTGKWDANSVAAMEKFQADNGFTPTGRPNLVSLDKLGLVYDSTVPKPPGK
jgi:hypothetical protein